MNGSDSSGLAMAVKQRATSMLVFVAVLIGAVLGISCRSVWDSSEPDEGDRYLAGAGYSFGMCGGPCVSDLAIDGSRVTHVVRGHFDPSPIVENSGELTAKARKDLRGFLGSLGEAG